MDILRCPRLSASRGFTLLEVMIVLTILGLIAAMFYPAAGLLNDRERRKITEKKMEEIRRAIVGDPDRFDEHGKRIIGGYVGDMGAWPGLYESMPEVRQHVMGTPPVFDTGLSTNLDYYLYRPVGHFIDKVWHWGYHVDDPYRNVNKLYRELNDDITYNNDHIGGLETENEGQPVGLWTDDPIGDGDELLSEESCAGVSWQGPYLIYPKDNKPQDAEHYATTEDEYEELDPVYIGALGAEEWEDGDYSPSDGDPGEHADDKEEFRLRQTKGRLADGWDHALRFFITQDPERAGGTIFWIISEGPDGEGTYPAKGTVSGTAWTVDANDTMGSGVDGYGYDPDDEYNQDNIVMKIHSYEWEEYFSRINQQKQEETEKLFLTIRRALVGDTTSGENGFNSGYTGAMCRWPLLFQWEDNDTPDDASDDYWDDEDATPDSYTKGQPRGLWTDKPNSSDAADNLNEVSLATPSIGWSGSYIVPPFGNLENEVLRDGWGREVLFFMDDGADGIIRTSDDILMVLSRGPDGSFNFLDSDTLPEGSAPDGDDDYCAPSSFTEEVDVTTYDPNAVYTDDDSVDHYYNLDNIVMFVNPTDWQPGWLQLEQFTVLNATAGITKAMFVFGWDSSSSVPLSTVLTAATLTDEDGDSASDDWLQDASGTPAFDFSDSSTYSAITGTRALVFWNDTNGNDAVDSTEMYQVIHYNILGDSGLEPRSNLEVDTTNFTAAP